MMKVLALAVLFGCAAAQYNQYKHQGGYEHGGYGGHEAQDYYTEPHYSFHYEVNDPKTYDIKSHHEERKGDHTQGAYSLVEPDGSKRTVEYTVEGKSGFLAQVHSEGSKHEGGYNKGYSGGYSAPSYSSGYSAPSYSSGYSAPSYSSGYSAPSYNKGYGGQSYSSYSSGGYKSSPAYHQYEQPSYKPSYHQYEQPSYKPSYSAPSYGGHASSSVSIATHGAKIDSSTYHGAPQKNSYYH